MDRCFFLAARIAVFCVLWLLPACKETPKERYERQLRETEGPMQHAVHSDRLLELMAQLKHLTYSRLPPELEQSRLTDQRIAEIRWIASGMSSAARYIPEVLSDVELPPERAQEFRRLASELRDQCQRFEQTAMSLSAETVRSVDGLVTEFADILDTCDSCHTRFRVLSKVREG